MWLILEYGLLVLMALLYIWSRRVEEKQVLPFFASPSSPLDSLGVVLPRFFPLIRF